ncbi:hypothetical protein V6N13_071626 [Hibiscus sabdariffa]|uniref:RNase H type-1 domain-containing protein n=1 Tax=Hibiscus sabdariffa TaxID=183260 RepID=A0ABR2TDR5_9ROSI
MLETDNKEVTNICNGLFLILANSILVSTIHDLLKLSWQVRLRHGCRTQNEVANKLVSLDQQHMLQERTFVVPPGPVVELVAVEQQRWEERRMAGASGI